LGLDRLALCPEAFSKMADNCGDELIGFLDGTLWFVPEFDVNAFLTGAQAPSFAR
jgi:hypothetical protein